MDKMKKNHRKDAMQRTSYLKTICLSLFLIVAFSGYAQPAQLMEEANAAYANKNYDRAAQTYEQLLADGYSSAALHYNLGNAYYRTQQLGKAILHYEKARQLAPGDEDIRHNLEVANSVQQDAMEPLPAFFLSKWWNGLRARVSANGWTIIALLFLWVAAGGFTLWLMGKARRQRKWGFLVGVILLILCVLPFSLALSRQHYDQHSKEAILLAREAQLHFAPDADSQVVLIIHEGLKVDLQDRISDWYKVRLPNGEVGWLPVEDLSEI